MPFWEKKISKKLYKHKLASESDSIYAVDKLKEEKNA